MRPWTECTETDEAARLTALDRLRVAGTEREARFDRVVELAAAMLNMPIALITFLERDRQVFKARVGVDVSETPISLSFCRHTVGDGCMTVVPDTTIDPRFADNVFVTGEPHVRFYAGTPIRSPGGEVIGTLCVLDTRARHRFSARNRANLEQLARLVEEQLERRALEHERAAMHGFADATGLGMIVVGADDRINFVNRSAEALFGYSNSELLGQGVDLIIPPHLRQGHAEAVRRMRLAGESSLNGKIIELDAMQKGGATLPVEMSISVWSTERGLEMGSVFRDISGRRARDARLMRLAHRDALTGLFNRWRFNDILETRFATGQASGLVLVDLDNFAAINERLARDAGDALLKAVAVRLPGAIPPDAILARFGGDVFGVILPEPSHESETEEVAQAILGQFSKPFIANARTFDLSASIGLANGPADGVDAEELVAAADYALCRAKQSGGAKLRRFDPDMRAERLVHHTMQNELARAVTNVEFELYYQPQTDLATGRTTGFEALLRWNHPDMGLLTPGDFMPALEDSALVQPVGDWVLEAAAKQLGSWRKAGFATVSLSVNLFAAQLHAASLTERIDELIERYELDPTRLEIEVTERIALDSQVALDTVNALRQRGLRIAFDDFGTGYASLSTLQRFPLTTLKIDRGFIASITKNALNTAITRAMIDMAGALGLTTIAEGIETFEQQALLHALGCDVGQGYLYGHPMPATEAATLLHAGTVPYCAHATARAG